MTEQQLMITREELADMYYAGSYWVDDGFGTAFDYVKFGIDVAKTIAERHAEQETKVVDPVGDLVVQQESQKG